MTILDELATYAKERVQKAQAVKSLEEKLLFLIM